MKGSNLFSWSAIFGFHRHFLTFRIPVIITATIKMHQTCKKHWIIIDFLHHDTARKYSIGISICSTWNYEVNQRYILIKSDILQSSIFFLLLASHSEDPDDEKPFWHLSNQCHARRVAPDVLENYFCLNDSVQAAVAIRTSPYFEKSPLLCSSGRVHSNRERLS